MNQPHRVLFRPPPFGVAAMRVHLRRYFVCHKLRVVLLGILLSIVVLTACTNLLKDRGPASDDGYGDSEDIDDGDDPCGTGKCEGSCGGSWDSEDNGDGSWDSEDNGGGSWDSEDSDDTAGKDRVGSGAYWNSWFQVEKIDGWERLTSLQADPDTRYRLTIDLAPLAYKYLDDIRTADFDTADVSIDISDAIDQRLADGFPTLTFVVRALVTDPTLKLAPGETSQKSFTIDLKRVKFPDIDDAVLQSMAKDHSGFLKHVADVHAGQITYDLTALSAGCASVAFSIWNSSGTLPLDHLIQPVTIVDRDGETPDCDLDGGLVSGLDNLARFGAGEEHRGYIPVDAALHVFEWGEGSRIKSVAVFVDRERYETADPKNATNNGVYAWSLKSPISPYVSGDGLLNQIKYARKQAVNRRAPGRSYAVAAEELRKRVFGARTEEGKDEAKAAYKALQRLTNNATEEIELFARLISIDDEVLFLPLDILEAAQDPYALNGLRVLHPLPLTYRFSKETSCIDAWSFALPEELDGLAIVPDLRKQLKELQVEERPAWLKRWIRRLPDLLNYFRSEASEEGTERGEGLLLLSHHNEGNLWFKRTAQPVSVIDMERKYSDGSVAILAACSTSLAGRSLPLIHELNYVGMDAFVMSPFPVRADYGARLALDFSDAIREARTAGTTPTISELFDAAADKTGEYFANRNRPDVGDMRLEFLVVGDYQLKLCSDN